MNRSIELGTKFENIADNSKNPKWKSTLAQVIAVFIKNIFMMAHGMTIAFPALLIPALAKSGVSEEFSLGQEGISWLGSIVFMCIMFGDLLSGIVMHPFGRKRAMQIISSIFFTAWLILYFSSKVWHIFTALIITGLAGGLMISPVVTYVAEVTQPRLRGILSSTSTICSTIGFMSQFIFAIFMNWRTIALCNAVIPIISFNLLFFIPETPIWLMTKKRYAEAKQSLAWLRGWVEFEDVEDEYKNLVNFVKASRVSMKKMTKFELFKQKSFLRPFLLVTYVFFFYHFIGITPLQTYSVDIFATFHSPIDKYYASAILGVATMSGCTIFLISIYYFGKRTLTFISLGGTTTCFIILAIYSNIFHIDSLLIFENSNKTLAQESYEENNKAFTEIPVITTILAVFLAQTGIRLLPWNLMGEVYPNEIKAIASGLTGAASHFLGFLCNKFFATMVHSFTLSGTFLFFSIMSFVGLISLYFILPETERRTLQEINDHFSGRIELGYKILDRRDKKMRQTLNVHDTNK